MAASDLVSVRGQVMEYTYIPTGIKGEMVRSIVDCRLKQIATQMRSFDIAEALISWKRSHTQTHYVDDAAITDCVRAAGLWSRWQ